MRKRNFNCIISIVIMLSAINTVTAQQNSESKKLLGNWSMTWYEFLVPNEDSVQMMEESKGIVLSFTGDNKFVTKKMNGNKVITVGTGTFSISADGKTLFQNGEEAEIIELTDTAFAFKMDEVIIHFKKQ